MSKDGFFSCFRQTFIACVTNIACAPFFLFAVLFYVFYYCWPYMAQLPLHLDALVVDQDNSPLSRRVVESLRSSPNFKIIGAINDKPLAVQAMQANEVSCLIGIAPEFEKNMLEGIPSSLWLVANGAFIVEARGTMNGLASILEHLVQEAVNLELRMRGLPAAVLERNKQPQLVTVALYNTISGYLSFAVAIVFVIIFQTIMICGMAMLLNSWFSARVVPQPLMLGIKYPVFLFAIQAPVFFICFFWILFVEGFGFAWQGINSFQNVPATLMVGVCFAWAVTSLGLFTGLLFKTSKFAIHAVVMSSLPCVFISGNLFAWQDIPLGLRLFASLLPSTPGVDAMLRASQAGANIQEVFFYLIHLLVLGALYFGIANIMIHSKWWQKRPPCMDN